MLLKSNIFDSKKIIVDMRNKFVNFSFCEKISVLINITAKKRRIIRTVKNTAQLTILAHFCIFVFVKIKSENLFFDRDYFFHSKKNFKNLKSKKDFFNHITNANIVIVQIRNIFNRSYILFKNAKINMFRDFEKKNVI